MRRTWVTSLCLTAGVLGAAAVAAQTTRELEVELRAAQYRERIQGDVAGAIATYQRLAAADDRAIASQALLALGQTLGRTGHHDAQTTFARVVSDFADMPAAAVARNLLGAQRTAGSSQRVLATGPDANQVWSSVSADGRYLPFSDPDTGNVAIRDLTNGRVQLVTKSKGYEEGFAEFAVWSPDSRQLAYSWWHVEKGQPSRMQLRVVGRENGTPRVVYRNDQLGWMQPLAWSPDGRSILAVLELARQSQMGLVAVSDGSFRLLKSGVSPERADFSPDGRYIAYDYAQPQAPMREINVMAVDGTNDRPLVSSPDHDFLLGWFPDGRHVLFGSDRLSTPGAWAVAVNNGAPQGDPFLVRADIGRTSSLGFDRRGRFYAYNSVAGTDVVVAEIDPATGKVTQQARPAPRAQPLARRDQATWSPDGRRLIYTQSLPGRGTALVVQTVATGELNVRPVTLRNIFRPSWFPDGTAVALRGQDAEGQMGIFRVDLGTGNVTPIVRPAQNFVAMTADGQSVLYARAQGIWRRRIADGTEQEVLRSPNAGTMAVSPDGQSMARRSGESIVVLSLAGGGERVLVGQVPGSLPRVGWSHDSQHVFYIAGRRELWRVPAAGGPAIDTGVRADGTRLISVSPNGRQIALSGGMEEAEVWVWENIRR